MKVLYTKLRTRIETECPSIKWVRLFNNQFDKSNADEGNEQAFPYPCVFIEFPSDNPMTSSGSGAKRLQVLVRVHIGFISYKLEDTTIFDVAEEVQIALEGYTTDGITPLTYLGQNMDYDHDNVYIYSFDFETQWSDETKWEKKDAITIAENTLSLTLNTDLDIDDIVIRTGDGE